MKVLFVGESCKDVFVYGSVNRLCPEAPVPVLEPEDIFENFGMTRNVFENFKCICDGEDVDLFGTVFTNEIAGSKNRYIDSKSNQMFLRVDSDVYLRPKDTVYDLDFGSYDAIIVSDYDKGLLSDDDLHYLGSQDCLTFLDTKKTYRNKWAQVFDFIKINEKECGENGFLIHEPFMENLIVTMGAEGCRFRKVHYPQDAPSRVFDVSGAGDTFLAAFAYRYIIRRNIPAAIEFAQLCCRNVVAKRGVSTP